MKSIVRRFVRFAVAHHKLVVCSAVLLTVLAGMIAARLTVDTGMDNMLPDDNAVVRTARDMELEFGTQDNVFIIVEGGSEQVGPFMDGLAERLRNQKLVSNVFHRVDREALEQYGPLYLDTELFRGLQAEMGDAESALSVFVDRPGIETLINLTITRLNTQSPAGRSTLIENWSNVIIPGQVRPVDNQVDALFAALVMNASGSVGTPTTGLLSSDDGKLHMMVLRPRISMQNFVLDRERFFTGLQTAIDEVSTDFPGLTAGFTGGSFVQDYEADTVAFNDFLSTALITFGLIMLLVVVSFRRLAVPLASGLPLLMGTILTCAFTVAVYGSINLFSISFAALLLGLGIDFAIHILARYQEERSKGSDVEEALCVTLTRTGAGMLIGALTTAVAFATFILAEFRAFTQMGVISAVGVLTALASMVVIMPAIIAWGDSRRGNSARQGAQFAFLGPLGHFTYRRPWLVPLSVLLGVVLTWGTVTTTNISTNMRELYPGDMQSLQWLKTMQEGFGYNPDTISLMADDLDELQRWTSALKALPSVARVSSVLDYLPTDQAFKLTLLMQIGTRLERGVARLAVTNLPPEGMTALAGQLADRLQQLIQASVAAGVPETAPGVNRLQAYIAKLHSRDGLQAMATLQANLLSVFSGTDYMQKLQPMTIDLLPAEILANYRGETGKLLVEVAPSGDIWEGASLRQFRQEIASVATPELSGMPLIMQEIVSLVKDDVLMVSIVATAVIFLMLLMSFRSFRDSLLAMAPVSITLLLTLGIGPHLGLSLNIINLMTLPLIIGIGVDNGVHITHRLRDGGVQSIPDALVHTGKAVTMTTLTTMIGFGSLTFTNHPGLASVGSMIVLGLSVCLLLSILLLPSLHVLLSGRSSRQTTVETEQVSS